MNSLATVKKHLWKRKRLTRYRYVSVSASETGWSAQTEKLPIWIQIYIKYPGGTKRKWFSFLAFFSIREVLLQLFFTHKWLKRLECRIWHHLLESYRVSLSHEAGDRQEWALWQRNRPERWLQNDPRIPSSTMHCYADNLGYPRL